MSQVGSFHQMPYRCGISAAQRDRFFHRRAHPSVAVCFDQVQHLDHLARAARLAMSIYEICE